MTPLDTLTYALKKAWLDAETGDAWQAVARLVQQKITTAQREAIKSALRGEAKDYSEGELEILARHYATDPTQDASAPPQTIDLPKEPDFETNPDGWELWRILYQTVTALNALQSRAEPR